VHRIWRIQGQLQGNVSAGRLANDVRALNPEDTHQRATVGGVLREGDRTSDTATASTSDAVVVHESIPRTEDRLIQEGREPVGVDPGVDEDHRFSAAMKLVLNFSTVDSGPIHLNPLRIRGVNDQLPQ
jgi:hypothetical protein